MAKTQQDVVIYNEKSFSTAQSQFEKDLKNQQLEGWRLVSVTPTKKRGFGHIVQLTAIYEKDVADDSGTSAATKSQERAQEAALKAENTAREAKLRAENKAKARAERLEKIKEAQRLAREKEEAYRASLSPEQLQQYRKRRRRNTLIIASIILVGSLLLCFLCGRAFSALSAANQSFVNSMDTPVPTDTPVPPTPTPNLGTQAGLVSYTKNLLGGVTLAGQISDVRAEGEVLYVTEYIASSGIWDLSLIHI